ncbi:hypothetical protein [Acinetobacter rudis]|uniref:Uncharacterized protein n=1 Tax=Acinetobacter rudis TaxID=632955 RepID=A0AAW8JA02_9GAMM|nr:hypothetical protein [Acinetobacter rudis]MDQ8935981.1 hypothetical protein [Acinetobacter rudis]MDQ8953827.1 hypothetical protein [Acinetobacter rudis]MDQ9018244.1 hypothetical protein [Acinetobacter rudis]
MPEQLTVFWNNFLDLFDALPEDSLAITVYVVGAIIIMWCWTSIMRRLPATLGCILWIVVFALIATPTISEGPNSEIAPATFGLLFGILTKDSVLIWSNLSLILFVIGLGLILSHWANKYRMLKKKATVADRPEGSPL